MTALSPLVSRTCSPCVSVFPLRLIRDPHPSYLQNGDQCGYNGEDCTLMEMTMVNPTCTGCGSSADISLIDP